RYFVPKHQQRTYGRAEVQRTLGTRDVTEAKLRLPRVIAEIQREIEEVVAGQLPTNLGDVKDVLRELDMIEARLRRGEYSDPDDPAVVHPADLAVDLIIDEHSARLGSRDEETGLSNKLSPEVLE